MTQSALFDENTPSLPEKLDDICRNRHGGEEMSELANDSMAAGPKDALRRKILDFIRNYPCTCDYVEKALGLRHQTCSARISELKSMGLIRKTGEKRKTESGRLASVLEIVG